MERARFVVVLEKPVSGENHEEDVLVRRSLDAWVNKGREVKSVSRCSILFQCHEKG